MLNFDEERYLRIQSGAAGLAAPIHAAMGAFLRAGAGNIFFLGTGGAAILMYPAARLLRQSSTFPVFTEMAAELILGDYPNLGPQSIVVIPSLSGTTKESIAALDHCRKRGAKIVTLVGHAESPLGKMADKAFVNFAEDDTSSESFYLQSLLIVLSLMHHRGECDDYETLVAELSGLPQALLDAKGAFEDKAATIAGRIAGDFYHVISGAGSVWAEAFYYGMCILEEMQWIRTRPVHASDFFHGTLELVEKGVSVILFKGDDECRPLSDRLESFARQYTNKLLVLDSKDVALPGFSDRTRALVSPIVLASLLERVSAHLEAQRNHPLTTRRYYRKVAY